MVWFSNAFLRLLSSLPTLTAAGSPRAPHFPHDYVFSLLSVASAISAACWLRCTITICSTIFGLFVGSTVLDPSSPVWDRPDIRAFSFVWLNLASLCSTYSLVIFCFLRQHCFVPPSRCTADCALSITPRGHRHVSSTLYLHNVPCWSGNGRAQGFTEYQNVYALAFLFCSRKRLRGLRVCSHNQEGKTTDSTRHRRRSKRRI
jgi:hypothetical protein